VPVTSSFIHRGVEITEDEAQESIDVVVAMAEFVSALIGR
jgi:hypothetical protein